MKTVQFKDVAVGSVFTVDNIEYKRVADTRISCCRSINAVASNDLKLTKQFQPNKEVQVND